MAAFGMARNRQPAYQVLVILGLPLSSFLLSLKQSPHMNSGDETWQMWNISPIF
jgi:hypothetical protein